MPPARVPDRPTIPTRWYSRPCSRPNSRPIPDIPRTFPVPSCPTMKSFRLIPSRLRSRLSSRPIPDPFIDRFPSRPVPPKNSFLSRPVPTRPDPSRTAEKSFPGSFSRTANKSCLPVLSSQQNASHVPVPFPSRREQTGAFSHTVPQEDPQKKPSAASQMFPSHTPP